MIKPHLLLASAAALLLLVPAALLYADEPHGVTGQTVGQVERLDPAIDALVPPGAEIEVCADGFEWAEGPVWLPGEGCIVFSDIPRNSVYRWSEAGGLSLYLKPAGYTGDDPRGGESGSNGLAVDAQGRLLLCQHGDRCVSFMNAPVGDPRPEYTPLATHYQNKRFNSPNDLAVHSGGAIFFTDPPYGLAKNMDDPNKEIPFQGVYRVDPDGQVTLLTDELPRPNGIALSVDERTLYVAQSHTPAKLVMAYDVADDLSLSGGRVFFDARELGKTRDGSPDGLKLDQSGNLFATGPGGVLVLSPEGKHLGTIMTGEKIANCGFGDDGRTLYMTSDRYLCRIRLTTTGAGFGR